MISRQVDRLPSGGAFAMLDREGKRGILRDSDNPILEEYKEDLLTRPILIAQSEEPNNILHLKS